MLQMTLLAFSLSLSHRAPPMTLLAALILLLPAEGSIVPTDLQANNAKDAVLDTDEVYLSWKLRLGDGESGGATAHQRSYRLVSSTSSSFDEIDWDTGIVDSHETLGIKYGGNRRSGLVVHWKVTVFDGSESATSESSSFEFGLLDPTDWGDSVWLMRDPNVPPLDNCSYFSWNATPIFQTHLPVPTTKSITSARLYIAGIGYFKAFLSSGTIPQPKKLGDSFLDPPDSTINKRVYYETFNITQRLAGGQKTLGVELGNGWWNPAPMLFWGHLNIRDYLVTGTPMFKAVVKVLFSDGSSAEYPSRAKSWKAGDGATLFNNIYLGEVFDARIENPWLSVTRTPIEDPNPKDVGTLRCRNIPSVTQQEVLAARQQGLPVPQPDNRYSVVFDSTKNHAGICSYEFHGKSGDKILMEYGELLHPNGSVNVYTSTAGQVKSFNKNQPCQPNLAKQAATLILKDGLTRWQPSFSWHGMRYIGINLPNGASIVSISCTPLRSNMTTVVELNTNDQSVKKLRDMTYNTFGSNLMGTQSDCPHRERFGYGGDALACGESALNMYDFSRFYAKRVLDFVDAQDPNGGYQEVTPYVGIASNGLGGTSGPIGWEAFVPEVQLWLYRYYGDISTLQTAFNSTYNYIKLLDTNPAAIQKGLGDWMPVEPTGVDFTGLGFQRMSYLAFSNISSILGYDTLSEAYLKKASNLTDFINSKFLDTKTGSYGNNEDDCPLSPLYAMGGNDSLTVTFRGSQTGQGMAISQNIVPSETRDLALGVLVDNIKSASNIPGSGQGPKVGGPGPHMLAGMFGTKWVMQSLSELGYTDLVYDIVVGQKTYPSYLWMSENEYTNATTIWESWFFSNDTYSHNHPMFISSEQWFIQGLAGLVPQPSAKGFDKVMIQPRPPLSMAQAAPNKKAFFDIRYSSVRGDFLISWTLDATSREFLLNITIPPNVVALVTIPGGVQQQLTQPGSHSYKSIVPVPPQ
eukprot:TRINITY_DN4170_c1_g1_i4.p1 TRINITY_DN4170_c1_g1~~TRINITY_DN4170_c1_g1_i4.p1  ORF type:complete len:996 (+),score=181.21 TRINITY_DN4170_c1_g1_i4:76-2988(+)